MNEQKESNSKSHTSRSKSVSLYLNFINAGLSGMLATCVVHPMDVLKNRMQMSTDGASLLRILENVVTREGPTKLYRGLSAGLLRQATYTTGRLGMYNELLDLWKANNATAPHFFMLCLMGMTAGVCGAFVGTPADVVLVRMSSDGRLPPDQRRNYKHVFDAFMRIYNEEGTRGLWRGAIPTMGRAAVVNSSQLATYSETKKILLDSYNVDDGLSLHFYASMISGIVTTFNSMPLDIAKTRIQNMEGSGKRMTMTAVIASVAKEEGIFALWKGFVPTYCKIGPHTVLTFILNEQLNKFCKKHFS